jgi:DNA-binding NarL/FixJ family response regulator
MDAVVPCASASHQTPNSQKSQQTREDEPMKFSLTPAELRVLRIVVTGYTNREAARELGVSESTIRCQLSNVFTKTGMGNRVELTRFAMVHLPEVHMEMESEL